MQCVVGVLGSGMVHRMSRPLTQDQSVLSGISGESGLSLVTSSTNRGKRAWRWGVLRRGGGVSRLDSAQRVASNGNLVSREHQPEVLLLPLAFEFSECELVERQDQRLFCRDFNA